METRWVFTEPKINDDRRSLGSTVALPREQAPRWMRQGCGPALFGSSASAENPLRLPISRSQDKQRRMDRDHCLDRRRRLVRLPPWNYDERVCVVLCVLTSASWPVSGRVDPSELHQRNHALCFPGLECCCDRPTSGFAGGRSATGDKGEGRGRGHVHAV